MGQTEQKETERRSAMLKRKQMGQTEQIKTYITRDEGVYGYIF